MLSREFSPGPGRTDKIVNSLQMSLRGYRVSGIMYHTRLLSTLYHSKESGRFKISRRLKIYRVCVFKDICKKYVKHVYILDLSFPFKSE